MDYSVYAGDDCTVKDYHFTVSDGVALKIIDFIPRRDNDKRPVIFFVAGWISAISGWRGVLKVISSQYRTIYLETREKRSSIIPKNKKVGFAMDRLSADIRETIDGLIPPRRTFILAGSSLGGTAILEYLAEKWRKPLCAILVGPNAEFRFPMFLGRVIPAFPPSFYLALKPIIKWYLRNFRLDKKNEQEQVKKYEATLDAADPYKLKYNAIAIRNYSIWHILPAVSTPVLVVGAALDKLHGNEALRKMVGALPRASYRELASNKETHSEKAGELIVAFINKRDYLEI
ncbi:MAG TPA: alpha/beta hydrolase [Spirochaetota bacterium]|nr:alpha/beta hydrolase [Spirochaetota bacterium]